MARINPGAPTSQRIATAPQTTPKTARRAEARAASENAIGVFESQGAFVQANHPRTVLGALGSTVDEMRATHGARTGSVVFDALLDLSPLRLLGLAISGAADLEKKLRPTPTAMVTDEELDDLFARFRGASPLNQACMLPKLAQWRANIDAQGDFTDDARGMVDELLRDGRALPPSLLRRGEQISKVLFDALDAVSPDDAGRLLEQFEALGDADQALVRPTLHELLFRPGGPMQPPHLSEAELMRSTPDAVELKRLVAPSPEAVVSWDATFT